MKESVNHKGETTALKTSLGVESGPHSRLAQDFVALRGKGGLKESPFSMPVEDAPDGGWPNP